MPLTPSPQPGPAPAGATRWRDRAAACAEWLGEALYPSHCGLCLAPGPAVCAGCQGDLPPLDHPCPTCALPLPEAGVCPTCIRQPPALDALHAGWAYAWPLDQLILAYKHGASTRAERVLAVLAQEVAERRLNPGPDRHRADLVIPVPLHGGRLRERGFNQADVLARRVAAVRGVALDNRGLRRERATDSQQALGRKARRRNVKGAFAWHGPDLDGRHVLVVDDVATTGATLSALAGVLRQAGAARVEGLVLARA